MQSQAKTPTEYIASLPTDRQESVTKLRSLIRKRLPKGYQEAMRFGMITYEVPLSVCPDTNNGQPLMYAALGSQKNHIGVYLCGLYSIAPLQKKFVTEWKKRGTKLDMGKSCLRLKSWENAELDLIGDVIEAVPMNEFVSIVQGIAGKSAAKKKTAKKKTAKKKSTKKKTAKKKTTKKKAAKKKTTKRKTAKKKTARRS